MIFLPQGMSRERETLLRLYGAQVEMVESLGGMGEAVDAARALAGRDDAFLPDQFSNPANPEAHRRTTGPEILDALDGDLDVLVAGVGTGGTITGVGEVLKQRNPRARVVAVEPASLAPSSPAGRRGRAPHPGHRRGLRPRRAQPRPARRGPDRAPTRTRSTRPGSSRDVRGCWPGCPAARRCGRALEVARRPESRGKRIVAILPDSGERYV